LNLLSIGKKIKTFVREEFNLFELLSNVIPKNLEAEHVIKIIRDPLGFIGAITEDIITNYTHGEFELSSELDVFLGLEEDLLRCLGLIIIHFVNERSNSFIKRIVDNQLLDIPSRAFLGFLKLSLKSLYPEGYKENFKTFFLGLFQRIIPKDIYDELETLNSNEFTNYVLEGCELALIDLGFKKSIDINIPMNELAFRPFNFILKVVNQTFEGIYDRIREMALDIIENDFRRLPMN